VDVYRGVIKYALAIVGIYLLCGLCTEVVWSLIKDFTLIASPFPLSIFRFHCFQLPLIKESFIAVVLQQDHKATGTSCFHVYCFVMANIAKVLNSTAKLTISIAKVMNSTANGQSQVQR